MQAVIVMLHKLNHESGVLFFRGEIIPFLSFGKSMPKMNLIKCRFYRVWMGDKNITPLIRFV